MITTTTTCTPTASVRTIGHESIRLYRLNPITFQADDSSLDAAAVDAAIEQEERARELGPLIGVVNGLVITAGALSLVALCGCMAGCGNNVELVVAIGLVAVCSLFLYAVGRAEGRF